MAWLFYKKVLDSNEMVGCDLNFKGSVHGKKFSFWFNLYYETLACILAFVQKFPKLTEYETAELPLVDDKHEIRENKIKEEKIRDNRRMPKNLFELVENLQFTDDLNELIDHLIILTGESFNKKELIMIVNKEQFDGSLRKEKGQSLDFVLEYELLQ